jgi:hypothetical protein
MTVQLSVIHAREDEANTESGRNVHFRRATTIAHVMVFLLRFTASRNLQNVEVLQTALAMGTQGTVPVIQNLRALFSSTRELCSEAE